ncbi:MAG: sigma 54-interacting transcriptional regulator [Hyphomicrobiales bacterium]
MLDILERGVDKVAPMRPCPAAGRVGTGKTYIARLAHRLSRRAKRPLLSRSTAAPSPRR